MTMELYLTLGLVLAPSAECFVISAFKAFPLSGPAQVKSAAPQSPPPSFSVTLAPAQNAVRSPLLPAAAKFKTLFERSKAAALKAGESPRTAPLFMHVQTSQRKAARQRFRQAALEFHPDKGGDVERFVEATQAYERERDARNQNLIGDVTVLAAAAAAAAAIVLQPHVDPLTMMIASALGLSALLEDGGTAAPAPEPLLCDTTGLLCAAAPPPSNPYFATRARMRQWFRF